MLKGIYLTLMIGPVVPVIAPKVVMDSISSIQVTNSADRSGFQITFSISNNSALLTSMLPAGYFDPITTRIIIVVTLNGMPNVLMDGLVTNHELSPSNETGKSTLTITGEDISLAMDLNQLIIPLPALPDVAKVYTVLSPFAALGVIPVVIPPIINLIKSPTSGWDSINKQTCKQYLKSFAENCGYVFFVLSGPAPGQNIAYFGPDINLPVPQRALTINMDAHSNVDTLSFSMNGLAKKMRMYTIFDPVTTKIPVPVPVPNINLLKPPMGVKPTPMWSTEFADDLSKDTPDKAASKIIGDLIGSSNNPPAITGTGSLDVMRYNGILRSRMLVGVRGGGLAYDGLYYVDSVTHSIKQGEYKQNFTLSRDGLISNIPTLPV
jgi:hypothetical protein